MAARDEQKQIGKGEAGIDESRRQRMPFEMVDRDQRLVGGMGERLAGHQPHHDPANEAWSGGRGDGIDVSKRNPRIGQHSGNNWRKPINVRARRDFGHDTPERAMLGLLACDAVRQNPPIAIDKRGCGFVAARFKAKDEKHNRAHPLPAPLSTGQAALAATR